MSTAADWYNRGLEDAARLLEIIAQSSTQEFSGHAKVLARSIREMSANSRPIATADTRSCWVIESGESPISAPVYWTGVGWDLDHVRALRFSRKTDAQRAASGIKDYDPFQDALPCRVVEKVWSAEL